MRCLIHLPRFRRAQTGERYPSARLVIKSPPCETVYNVRITMKLNRPVAFRVTPYLALLIGFVAYGPSLPPAFAGTKTLSGMIRDVRATEC